MWQLTSTNYQHHTFKISEPLHTQLYFDSIGGCVKTITFELTVNYDPWQSLLVFFRLSWLYLFSFLHWICLCVVLSSFTLSVIYKHNTLIKKALQESSYDPPENIYTATFCQVSKVHFLLYPSWRCYPQDLFRLINWQPLKRSRWWQRILLLTEFNAFLISRFTVIVIE